MSNVHIKAKSRKSVTLPSGISVVIGRLWLSDLMALGEIPVPFSGDRKNEEAQSIREFERYAIKAVVEACIEPRFTDDPVFRDAEDYLYIGPGRKDISRDDFIALAQEIFAFSGLSREVAADADTFRNDRERKDRIGHGADLSQTTIGDTQTDARGILPKFGDNEPRGVTSP